MGWKPCQPQDGETMTGAMHPKASWLRCWWPAVVMMLVIFAFSSIPSRELPNFSWADLFVKKGGHMLGYALLALAYARALGWDRKRWWLPWVLAILFAATDEFHQSFVPGRHPSPVDVGIDAAGGGLGLLAWYGLIKPAAERRGKVWR